MLLTCGLLGSVSLIMCIMNIFTHKTVLMIATLSFAVLSYINVVILRVKKQANRLSYGLFEASIVALFTYFILTGGTAGFSPHWILILPACGMILLGSRRGLLLSWLQFGIVAFFLWVPLGKSLLMYEYTPEFCMRFPVVYLAFFAIGYCFEAIRAATYNAMVSAQKELEIISQTDTLTLLPNRYWFNLVINRKYDKRPVEKDGVMLIIDIDDFKSVNDSYGHAVGDEALRRVANAISEQLRRTDMVCRWGGEEFFAYLPGCDFSEISCVCGRICAAVRETGIEDGNQGNFSVTVSIGAIPIPANTVMEADELFNEADRCLYVAKEQGKDGFFIGKGPMR